MTATSERLSAHFALDDHKKKPGQNLTYVPTGKYIERLNEIFGTDWSWTIVSKSVDYENRFAVVEGVLSYPNENGSTCTKSGVGMDEGKSNPKKELDAVLKSANSEAIKNACKLLGIGLYMYDKDELAAVEQAIRSPRTARPAQAAPADRPWQTPEWLAASKKLQTIVGRLAREQRVSADARDGYMKALIKDRYHKDSSTKCAHTQLDALADLLDGGHVKLVPVLGQPDAKEAAAILAKEAAEAARAVA